MSNKDNRIGEKSVLNIGFGNVVAAARVVAILESGSLPVRRHRERAAERNHLIDATAGRKMRSLIFTDSEHVILSALTPQTLEARLRGAPLQGRNESEDPEFVS